MPGPRGGTSPHERVPLHEALHSSHTASTIARKFSGGMGGLISLEDATNMPPVSRMGSNTIFLSLTTHRIIVESGSSSHQNKLPRQRVTHPSRSRRQMHLEQFLGFDLVQSSPIGTTGMENALRRNVV